jgi:hypothetical protein
MSPYWKWLCAVSTGVCATYVAPTASGFVFLFLALLFGALSLPRHFWN